MKRTNQKDILATAAQEAVHAIAQAAELAKKTIANAAAEAVKVNAYKNADGTNDHDTITTLVGSVKDLDSKVSEKFADIKADIKEIKDGTKEQISAHELQIKKNVSDILVMKTQMRTWGVAISAFWALLTVVIHYIK